MRHSCFLHHCVSVTKLTLRFSDLSVSVTLLWLSISDFRDNARAVRKWDSIRSVSDWDNADTVSEGVQTETPPIRYPWASVWNSADWYRISSVSVTTDALMIIISGCQIALKHIIQRWFKPWIVKADYHFKKDIIFEENVCSKPC
jgi:hypothetical protein